MFSLKIYKQIKIHKSKAHKIFCTSTTITTAITDNSEIDGVSTTTPTLQNNNLLLGRGMIVSDYVASNDSTIEDYNQNLVADCIKYSAFNFLSIQIQ